MNKEPTLSAGMKLVAIFQVKSPQGEKTFRIHKERVIVGSLPSSDIRLEGQDIAPIHAVIEWNGSEATLYDLDSDIGLKVNGKEAITQVLKAGDQIEIGSHQMNFSTEDLQSMIPKFKPKTAGNRKLFHSADEELKPLLLESESTIEDIFEYPSKGEKALEIVMSWMRMILTIEHFTKEKEVRLGPSPFVAPDNVKLINRAGSDYFLQLDSKMEGVLQRQGSLTRLEDVAQSGSRIPFKPGDFAKITMGELDYYLCFSEAPPHLKRQSLVERDPFFYRILFGSLALSALILFSLFKIQIDPRIEAEEMPERIATILYQPEKFPPKPLMPETKPETKPEVKKEEPKPPKKVEVDLKPKLTLEKKPIPKEMDVGKTKEQAKPKVQAKQENKAKEGEGVRAKGAEGQRGKPNAPKKTTPQTKAFRPSPMGGTGRGGGNSQARPEEGNIDLMSGEGARIENLLGNAAEKIGSGGSKLKGFGGFDTEGNGGLGAAGLGKGGGGQAESLGGLGKKGIGGGRVGTGAGAVGNGPGLVGGRSRVNIRSGGPEETVVMGALDYDAIQAALLAHKDEFRLCYERELNAENPNLGGRVGTNFVIGSSGRVGTAAILSSSIKNANVERCILEVIKRIDFPKPKGGAEVSVNYPFRYSSGAK